MSRLKASLKINGINHFDSLHKSDYSYSKIYSLNLHTYFFYLAIVNQVVDGLDREIHKAFLSWIPVRRHTKETLEHLAGNLRKPGIATRAKVGFALGALAAPFTFGASLMVAPAGAGIGAAIGAGASYLSTKAEKKLRLAEVQQAIDTDRRACAELRRQLLSLTRTFISSAETSTSAGATVSTMVRSAVSDALTRASRFAESSVLPRDVTQLLKSSLDRHRGSTSPIVAEIRGILDNLKSR